MIKPDIYKGKNKNNLALMFHIDSHYRKRSRHVLRVTQKDWYIRVQHSRFNGKNDKIFPSIAFLLAL